MTITLKSIYEEITTQSWSIFDSDISSLEDDDAGVISTIKKALNELWNGYKYSFKVKTKNITLQAETNNISKVTGKIKKVILVDEDGDETEIKCSGNDLLSSNKGEPKEYFIKYNKIYFKPTPTEPCNIKIDYYNSFPVLSKKGEPQTNFKELTDYIDIKEEYEDLFLRALITRTMALYPHPNQLIHATYEKQSEKAFKLLIEACNVNNRGKQRTW